MSGRTEGGVAEHYLDELRNCAASQPESQP